MGHKRLTDFRNITPFISASIVAVILIFTYPLTVSAIDGNTPSVKGLTLSPLRAELDIEPGTSLNGVLKVTNFSTKPMLVTMSAEVFSVINQQYDYAFTAESNVVKWVTFNISEINLEPGNSQDIKYTVGVPLSAEPGGRYISLFASTDASESKGTSVESKQRVASLLYITVTGDVSRAGQLISLSSPWVVSGDSTWSAALQNTGTTHYRSRYKLQIKDLIFDEKAAGMSGEALILPGTVRLVPDKLPAPFWPGLYKAVYDIGLGDSPAVTKVKLILYMSVWSVLVIIIIISLLIFWIYRKLSGKKASLFEGLLYKLRMQRTRRRA